MPSILLLTCIGSHIKDSLTRFIDRFSSLQNKHIRDIITHSFSSPEALEEVVKLKLSCYSLDLYIADEITFSISLDQENRLSLELGLLVLPGVFRGKEEWNYEWKIPEFSIRDVPNHFTRIFSRIRIKSLQVYCEMTNFDLSFVKNELRGVQFEILGIMMPQSIRDVKESINLLPYPDILCFFKNQAVEDVGYLKTIAIRNFEGIKSFSCDLDVLLMFNASRIQVNASNWTNKELNRFLKLCIKGAMKNLENLTIYNNNGWDLNAVLKGIRIKKSPSGLYEFRQEDGEEMMVVDDEMPNVITFQFGAVVRRV
uniref:FBA_2 domain-containing protein n=1 Tax=Caenorhabditis tropicalis TaxID=1561998 RepID=A0A1I7THB4_9PELO